MAFDRRSRSLRPCRSTASPCDEKPDKETARRFANLLIKEFVSSGRYSDSTRIRLEVKDDTGALLLSIPFPHIA